MAYSTTAPACSRSLAWPRTMYWLPLPVMAAPEEMGVTMGMPASSETSMAARVTEELTEPMMATTSS